MAEDISIEEKILFGLLLCSHKTDEMLSTLKPEWNDLTDCTPRQKIERCGFHFPLSDIFPWQRELSEEVNYEKFCESFLIQPDLFLRLRPGYEDVTKSRLTSAGISFSLIDSNCIALPNSSKIDSLIELDKEAIVQDLSSQKIGSLFKLIKPKQSDRFNNAWDCCAASGGKSLMLHDMFPGVKLTVSDRRESILINLSKRFAKAGIVSYKRFTADLSVPLKQISKSRYQLIIADVPCSGSGTWSRTPEQLYFFDESKINEYSNLQKKIVDNVVPYIEPGGFLLYITCSVFKKENEEMLSFIKQNYNLQLVRTDLFTGYDKKADTLFAALFQQPLQF